MSTALLLVLLLQCFSPFDRGCRNPFSFLRVRVLALFFWLCCEKRELKARESSPYSARFRTFAKTSLDPAG